MPEGGRRKSEVRSRRSEDGGRGAEFDLDFEPGFTVVTGETGADPSRSIG